MIDNHHFKTVKKWKYHLKQSQPPTTAGVESLVTTDGIVGNDMNTDAYDSDKIYKVLKDDTKIGQRSDFSDSAN